MKKYTLSLLLILTVYTGYTQNLQKNTYLQNLNDSVVIPKRFLIANTQALIELKSYKGNIEGFLNDRVRNKDIVINALQKENEKLKKLDYNNYLLTEQFKKDSIVMSNQIFYLNSERKKEKAKKIGIGITVPIAAILGFLLGFYLPH